MTDELIRWTIRAALFFYVVSLSLRLFNPRRTQTARLLWTTGCLAFWLHMIAAFGFVHHGSHAEAYAATAQRTAEVIGLDWGGGVYANYAFALIWLADVGWWWWDDRRYSARSWSSEAAVQGFLAFIWLNATIVFGHGAIRWFGAGGCVALFAAAAFARRR